MKTITAVFVFTLVIMGCKKDKNATDPTNKDAFHSRGVGASANELLSASKFKSLKIEIDYMPGFEPDAAAVNNLQSFLQAYLNKPAGISTSTSQVSASANTTLNIEQVSDLEDQHRNMFASGEELTVYLLYTNGSYKESGVLGVAYKNTSTAVFGKTIRDNSGGIGQASRTKLETTVLEHEVSHLLGLVNVGTSMATPHQDGAHGNHCNNSGCLMYYAAETTDITGFLLTGNIPTLDANCVNDLKGNGGK